MAKIEFLGTLSGASIFQTEMTLDLTVKGNGDKAVYSNDSGDKIVVFGDNLKEGGKEGQFASGTIEKLVFRTAEGQDFLVVSEGDYVAKSLNHGNDQYGAFGIYNALFGSDDLIIGDFGSELLSGQKGDDRIKGRAGVDQLFGGKGDDVMTGGQDGDTFIFDPSDGVGHDRITDFDLSGDDMDALVLAFDIDQISKTNAGKDTMIIFDKGSTLELDGVTKADFLEFWNTPTMSTD